MKYEPLRDRRKVARDLRGGVPGCGHFLPEDAPAGMPRGRRRLLAHV